MIKTFLRYRQLLLLSSLLIMTCPAQAITLPIFVKYSLIQELMLRELFKGPKQTANYRLDETGCAKVSLSNPALAGIEGLLQVSANLLVTTGMPTGQQHCSLAKTWPGSALVQGKPLITTPDGLTIHFKVTDVKAFDAAGKPFNNSLIKIALESQLHPVLDQLSVDLKPHLKQLIASLPLKLLGYSTAQAEQLMSNVHINDIQVRQDGLNIIVKLAMRQQPIFKF